VTITRALATLDITLPPRPQRLALQRHRHSEERITGRVVELRFPDVRAHTWPTGSSSGSGCWPMSPPSLARIGGRRGG